MLIENSHQGDQPRIISLRSHLGKEKFTSCKLLKDYKFIWGLFLLQLIAKPTYLIIFHIFYANRLSDRNQL
ncbi:hypothetical protein Pse7367_0378 [Thalassoporum mexicanum PCC 7367]|nr:hypothetical protein Pse7367_0378 [Pseudanabaena sp. PCC 7367]